VGTLGVRGVGDLTVRKPDAGGGVVAAGTISALGSATPILTNNVQPTMVVTIYIKL
jgi:hypothetical protein